MISDKFFQSKIVKFFPYRRCYEGWDLHFTLLQITLLTQEFFVFSFLFIFIIQSRSRTESCGRLTKLEQNFQKNLISSTILLTLQFY